MKLVTVILGLFGATVLALGILNLGDDATAFMFNYTSEFSNWLFESLGAFFLVTTFFYATKNPVGFILARILVLAVLGFTVFMLTGKAAQFDFDLGFFVGVAVWVLSAVFYPMVAKTREEF